MTDENPHLADLVCGDPRRCSHRRRLHLRAATVSGTIVSKDHKPASEIGTFWGVIEEKARW